MEECFSSLGMNDEFDEDGPAVNLPLSIDDENCLDDICVKRKRLDATSPTSIDVSSLNGRFPTSQDPNRQNRFSILADLEIESNNTVTSAKRNNIVNDERSQPMKPASKPFCPPIFLYNVNVGLLCQQLEAKTPKICFKIKNVNNHKAKLYLSDASVHAEMMTILREKKINSYSFTPKEMKQESLVLRGLYYSTEVNDIKAALDESSPGIVSKVTKFTTTFSKKNNLDTGLFLISLVPGKKLGDVSSVKFLLNQCIVWEKPKRKSLS